MVLADMRVKVGTKQHSVQSRKKLLLIQICKDRINPLMTKYFNVYNIYTKYNVIIQPMPKKSAMYMYMLVKK